jgi:general secretion pathway protein D
MIKTYISALLVVFVVAAQMVHAQDNMDDVFAQLDAGSGADDAAALETMEPEGGMTSAEVESGEEVQAVPEEETLALLKEKGAAHYKAGKYDEAIRMFDAMLAIDEYNADALAYRKRAARRIASKETKKQGASRAQAFADVKGAWNAAPKVLGKVDVGSGAEADPEQIAIDQMVARLKAINIPVLDFDNTGIEDVVLYLTESSRKLDSAGKGVNILLVGMDSAEGARNVTTVITDINLFDALQVVSEMASLKFEVKSGAVAIMPANYVPVSAMVMQSYDIVPEVGQDLEAFSGDAGGSVDDLFGDSSQSAAQGPVDVAGFFSIVEFPEGASAIYRPRFHKLFVKNTPENLKAVEAVLADLDDRAIKRRSQQVEIEAKFVEFNEGSLEELGFDWTVYGSGSIAGFTMKDGSYFQGDSGYTEQINTLPAGSGPLYTSPVNGQSYLDPASNPNMLNGRQGQNFFGSGQRNNGDVGGGGIGGAFEALQSGLLTKMGGAPASMLFSNGDVDLQISAMEQEGTADVLSAPKVTTKSGSEAIIRVAETHRYPQDYDVETGQRTAPVVKPQDWEDRDLGVSLRVTPVVDDEGDTIDLELQPEIIEFRGYDPYIVGYNTQTPAGGIQLPDTTLYAQMAFFERRLVSTQVTIADGHTVVMGGLVDERTETFRDQVPFLGDIPYLGRLFRTEGSRSAKKNLTIFVTATQVDVNGMTSAERELARQ